MRPAKSGRAPAVPEVPRPDRISGQSAWGGGREDPPGVERGNCGVMGDRTHHCPSRPAPPPAPGSGPEMKSLPSSWISV